MGLDKVCYNINWKFLRLQKTDGFLGYSAHKNIFHFVHISDGRRILFNTAHFIDRSRKIFKENYSVKKINVLLVLAVLLVAVVPFYAVNTFAKNESSATIDPDTLITYGYLQQFKEELKQEIIDELTANGGITVTTAYEDISLKKGQIIILSADSEIIYRGGGAAAVTSSNDSGEGITDMSENTELFSGESLEYGHIYFASEGSSRRAILVTGDTAYFTVRGYYEIA